MFIGRARAGLSVKRPMRRRNDRNGKDRQAYAAPTRTVYTECFVHHKATFS